MKNKIFCALAFILCPVLANASKSASVTLNDEQPYKTIQVTDERYEPIYEDRDYEDTCHREVITRYETRCNTTYEEHCSGGGTSCSGGGTVCTTENDSVCNSHGCVNVPRRSCHTESESCHTEAPTCTSIPRESCSEYPVYGSETYSCTRTRTVIVGHELVKTFKNQITVAFTDSPDQAEIFKGANLTINLNINESSVSASLQNPFPLAGLIAEVKKISHSEESGVVTTKTSVIISSKILGEKLNKILSASIENLKLGYSKVDFSLKDGALLKDLVKINLYLQQDRRAISETEKFSGIVPNHALSVSTEGKDLKFSINLQNLNIKLKGKKHNLAVNASLIDQELLNKSDFKSAFEKSVEQKAEGVYPQ